MKVLVVDDDDDLRAFLVAHLPSYFFVADEALDGASAIALSSINEYDLVLLDLNLPDMSGEVVCRNICTQERPPPILMLAAAADAHTKVRLLDSGADDYMAKPFVFEELIARMRALLRRPAYVLPTVLRVGGLVLDVGRQVVYRNGREVALTRKEFALLEYLMRHPGEVVSKGALIEHAWDSATNMFSNAIDIHMSHLRKKLGSPEVIRTIHSRGYAID